MKTENTTQQAKQGLLLFYIVAGFSLALIVSLICWFSLRRGYGIDALDYLMIGLFLIIPPMMLKQKKAGWVAGLVLAVFQLFRLCAWTLSHLHEPILTTALVSGLSMGVIVFLLAAPFGWRLFFDTRGQMEQSLLLCGGILTLVILCYFKTCI